MSIFSYKRLSFILFGALLLASTPSAAQDKKFPENLADLYMRIKDDLHNLEDPQKVNIISNQINYTSQPVTRSVKEEVYVWQVRIDTYSKEFAEMRKMPKYLVADDMPKNLYYLGYSQFTEGADVSCQIRALFADASSKGMEQETAFYGAMKDRANRVEMPTGMNSALPFMAISNNPKLKSRDIILTVTDDDKKVGDELSQRLFLYRYQYDNYNKAHYYAFNVWCDDKTIDSLEKILSKDAAIQFPAEKTSGELIYKLPKYYKLIVSEYMKRIK